MGSIRRKVLTITKVGVVAVILATTPAPALAASREGAAISEVSAAQFAPRTNSAAPEDAPTSTGPSAQPLVPWPSVSPSPEVWRQNTTLTQQQAADWVSACPPGRFCTWIRHRGNDYIDLFQFYRCQEYTLSNWLGISDFYNNQNVATDLLGSRHEFIRRESPGLHFITNWSPIFYINLCAS